MNEIKRKKKELTDSEKLEKVVAAVSELKAHIVGVRKILKLIAYLIALFIAGVVTMFLVFILLIYNG